MPALCRCWLRHRSRVTQTDTLTWLVEGRCVFHHPFTYSCGITDCIGYSSVTFYMFTYPSSFCSHAHISPILSPQTIAADCKRVTVLKYFLEALCGQEEPLLAFKGGKYISVATSPPPTHSVDERGRQDSLTEKEVCFFSPTFPLITCSLHTAPSAVISDCTPSSPNLTYS